MRGDDALRRPWASERAAARVPRSPSVGVTVVRVRKVGVVVDERRVRVGVRVRFARRRGVVVLVVLVVDVRVLVLEPLV